MGNDAGVALSADRVVDPSLFMSPPARAARDRIDAVSGDLVALSHAIAADPELAYDEYRAAARCADLLEARGLTVERGAYGLPTAFAARAGTADRTSWCAPSTTRCPVSGTPAGTTSSLRRPSGPGSRWPRSPRTAGLRVTVLGTPAEESGGGKVDLIRAGALEGVDSAMMVHPAPFDVHDSRGLAIEEWEVVYTGQASHASSAPQLGLNALDGVVAGLHGARHAAPAPGALAAGARRHHRRRRGTQRRAGARRRVVLPAGDRHARAGGPAAARPRLPRGCGTATGTTVEITQVGHAVRAGEAATRPGRGVRRGVRRDRPSVHARPGGCDELGGSTDFGNISQLVPAVHADLAVHSWPAVNHQHEFAAHCVTPAGDRTMLEGAAALALTALAVAADPLLLEH